MIRFLRSLLVIAQGEPILVRTGVGLALATLVQFGVPVTDGQAKAIDALLVVVLALSARTKVAPLATMPKAAPAAEGDTIAATLERWRRQRGI